jgi:hypothetical protein
MNRFIFAFLAFVFPLNNLFGQSINSVTASQVGNTIKIEYTLTGVASIARIEVYYKCNECGNEWNLIDKASFDGKMRDVLPGTNTLVWRVLNNPKTQNGLVINDKSFRVKIEPFLTSAQEEENKRIQKLREAEQEKASKIAGITADLNRARRTEAVFGSLSLATAAAGIYYVYDAKNAYAAYQNATTDADALRSRVKRARILWPILFSTSALSLIPTISGHSNKLYYKYILDRENSSANLSFDPLNNGVLFTFDVKF